MMKPNHVYIEVSHNQSGGLSLCVSNDSNGYRISGDKVGGCETLARFEVNAAELIAQIFEHMNAEGGQMSKPTYEELEAALKELRRIAFSARRNSHNCGPFQYSELCEEIIDMTVLIKEKTQ